MKIKKTLVSVLCLIAILMSAFTTYAADVTFTDVENGKWYTEHINYAVENGIFNGTSATTFSPDTNMTRAQFVQVFANISNVDTSNKNVKSSFSDVPSGKWYTAAVKWAAENGVVNGMGNGKFAPEEPVTREQMCVMLVNYVEKFQKESLQSKIDTKTFSDDAKIASWAKEYVYKCAKAGLVNGVGDNKFAPQGTTTRAQGATFFSNFHKYVNTSTDDSWFAKMGFEITPLTNDLCTNDNPEHICTGDEEFTIIEEVLGDGNKRIVICVTSQNAPLRECAPYGFNSNRVLAIDRNTGAVLSHDYGDFFEYNINGEKVSIKWEGDGGHRWVYECAIICPQDYNDVVFVATNTFKKIPWGEDYSTTRTIDEFIDFETVEYYFFSYNDK